MPVQIPAATRGYSDYILYPNLTETAVQDATPTESYGNFGLDPSTPSGPSSCGRDVGVHPEQVRRVVPGLEARQLAVLLRAAEGLDHAVLLVEVEHVDVDAAAGPRGQAGDGLAGAGDVILVVGRVVPAHGEVQPEQVAAVGERVDGLVGQVGDVRLLGVVAVTVLELDVDEPLHAGRERQHGAGLNARLAGLGQAADRLGARRVLGVVQPHRDQHEQALADVGGRDERQGRHVVLERGVPADRAGQGGHDAGVLAQRGGRLLRLVDRDPDAHHRAEVVGAEGEAGDDAEVAAAAAQRPEQLGVLARANLDHLAGRQHELKGDKVVAGETVDR